MAGKILSIEIGNSTTRICEMDYRVKEPKVHKYFCIPTPAGSIEDGFVTEKQDLALAIKKVIAENKIKTKQVVFTVTSGKIVTREITMPVLKPNQIGNFVKANASDYFPIDLSSYEIAHVVLGMDSSEEGNEKLRVLAIAAGRDLIVGYSNFAMACGLRMVTIDYSGNSVYQIMKTECAESTKLIIKVEDNNTIATIISNHNLLLQRNIAYGFERAVQAYMDMADAYDMRPFDAFMQMTGRSFIKPILNEKTRMIERDEVLNETEEESEKRKRITTTFSQLVSNLSRVIELYNSRGAKEPITEIVLVGMGAEIAGLRVLLTNELRIQTKTIRSFASVSAFQQMDAEGMGRYVGIIGASIAPIAFAGDVVKQKGTVKIPYSLITTLVYVVFFAVIGVLLGTAYMKQMAAEKNASELKALEAQYAEAEVVHKKYLAMSDFYVDMKYKHDMTKHSNDNLITFLTEIEDELITDMIVTSFYSDMDGVRMTIHVPELEESAVVIQKFRDISSLMDVTVEAVNGESDFPGYYTMELKGYYFPAILGESTEETVTE